MKLEKNDQYLFTKVPFGLIDGAVQWKMTATSNIQKTFEKMVVLPTIEIEQHLGGTNLVFTFTNDQKAIKNTFKAWGISEFYDQFTARQLGAYVFIPTPLGVAKGERNCNVLFLLYNEGGTIYLILLWVDVANLYENYKLRNPEPLPVLEMLYDELLMLILHQCIPRLLQLKKAAQP